MITAKFAQSTPNADAIIDQTGQRITFSELDEKVCRLANGLASLGMKKGDRVAILSQNSIEFMALYYACARGGYIALGLNWRLAAPELVRVLQDAEPTVFISQGQFRDTTSDIKTAIPEIKQWLEYAEGSDGSLEQLIDSASHSEPAGSENIGDDDPLYILYTGGTTGKSKGVLHTHKSTYSAFVNTTATERIATTDVYMLTGQMFHSPMVLAMSYMAHGRPVVLINFEPKLALELIEKERVSTFLGLTTMLNWMLAVEGFENYDLSSLRHITYGGGPMASTVIKEGMKQFGCNFLGLYGQTEGIIMTGLLPEDHTAIVNGVNPERIRSCGREAFLTSIRVVDENGNDVPKDGNTAGEIIVKSPANMIGYWRQPDLTNETIKDGWMYTADIATWDEDSYIFIVDRAKDMIISGGENIYTSQVEDAIYKHPSVLETTVIGIPDDEWGEIVKAYVVLKPGMSATEQEIIDTARQQLASYQKPRAVEFIEALPKAPTGKVLKRALRDAAWQGRERQV